MTSGALPKWIYPPEGRAWTVDDLENLPPEAPRHVEIIDSALVVRSPQNAFHSRVVGAIENGLAAQAPEHLMVARQLTMALPDGDAPEPDIVVFGRTAYEGPDQTRVAAANVVLAVEVISPDSRKRDLFRKPQLYAHAGIDYLWIVDDEADATIVRTYHIDPRGCYQPTGEHRDQVSVTMPFALTLDVSFSALGL